MCGNNEFHRILHQFFAFAEPSIRSVFVSFAIFCAILSAGMAGQAQRGDDSASNIDL
jgi:hypothetical protein